MADSTTIVSLGQLVDLALINTDRGVVNFGLMHALLHAMIDKMNLQDVSIEFIGKQSVEIQRFITAIGSPSDVKGSTIVMKQSRGSISSGEFTAAFTKESFEKLKKDVDRLKKKVGQLMNISPNSELIDTVSASEGEMKPVQDMFQLLTVQRRLDASEMALKKLCNMVENLIKASGGNTEMLNQLEELQKDAESGGVNETMLKGIERRLAALENAMALGGAPIPQPGGAAAESTEIGSQVDLAEFDLSSVSILTAMELFKKNLATMKEHLASVPQLNRDMGEMKKLLSTDPEAAPPEMRLKMLEQKFGDTMDQISSLDNNYCRQLNALQNRLTDMERETAELLEKANVGGGGGKAAEAGVSAEVAAVVASLQEEMTIITEHMENLVSDKERGDHLLDVISEQVELLKTIKADREDLEDALADKADACQINRKVSFEQFDQACGDMSRTIEEALSKLGQQEMLWTQALTDIQNNVGNKLDRMELNPLRDFINNKLRSLQEKFRALTAMKKEQEAAGTKSKYLRNVNCISCDKDVVMRKEMDPTQFPKPYASQPTRSMGPYLAYELDQLRKQQKCLPNSKNMNMFENALQAGKASRKPDHICNRYCGGSHTVTTPQQRVTRLGHFLEQWGPELAPVNDTHVRGTDGKMYKARDDEFLKKMAAEKPPSQHAELPPPIQVVPGGGEDIGSGKLQEAGGPDTIKRSPASATAIQPPPSSTAQAAETAALQSAPASPKASATAADSENESGAGTAREMKRPSTGSVGRSASKASNQMNQEGRRSRNSKDMTQSQSKTQSLPKVPIAGIEQSAPAEPAEESPAEE